MIDKNYCMSHYLAFRYVRNTSKGFFNEAGHQLFLTRPNGDLTTCKNAKDIDFVIRQKLEEFYLPGKTALLLSGGIDSAILASYLPEGTKVYTFKCIASGAIDETAQAARYASTYRLDHEIIEMNWSDFESLTGDICRFQNVPVHSIEIQLYKAAMHAKAQGIERMIVGESADLVFGGMDKLLAKDWDYDAFMRRYTFVEPAHVLRDPVDVEPLYAEFRQEKGKIDFLRFLDEIYAIESSTSYLHAFTMAGLDYLDPYSFMVMSDPLDLNRVRNGEPKYLLRELFSQRYPDIPVPNKIPMPRAMDQWLADWNGPVRPEFLPGCVQGMSGDQKWLVWCLERYLDVMEQV